ncbi:MAG: pyruvate, phosphate dikinase [Balneolaceae bacterium]
MKTTTAEYIYTFGNGRADGDRSMRDLLGGKGANLAEMSAIDLPVPPGFTISTKACQYYSTHELSWPEYLEEEIRRGIGYLESAMSAGFGDPKNPLLVSVRSGAAVSMPGMMDTVLDLGLNDETVEALSRKTGNERFAYDCFRRFIDMFGNVVMNIDHNKFEKVIEEVKQAQGIQHDTKLTAANLKVIVERFKAVYRNETDLMFPDDPYEQLKLAVNAVFDSWNSKRAMTYRRINHITGVLGTAVNVQTMVYGNMGEDCATGVCFTRNPSTGENKLYGEFLINAQGEDVVAGIRTPEDISHLKEKMPESYNELLELGKKLEKHYGNMQDIEFTIQNNKLYILQTRTGKRTGKSAVKIAIQMVEEGIISKRDAVEKLVEPNHLDQLLHPQIDNSILAETDIIGTGLPASPGAAVGKVVFSAEKAEEAAENNDPVILVRIETSPEDVGGMSAAEGILTSRGGMTSHAAVVARGWGKPCVAGCGNIVINYENKSFTNGYITVNEGEWISIDGTLGSVIAGQKPVIKPALDNDYHLFMEWVDSFRDMSVRTNADTPQDAEKAIEFGAEGIGLCRTEHMFFGEERIRAIRRMIFSNSVEERKKSLSILLPYQRQDFIEIFNIMKEKPVTIRLLDPPLHEFLPSEPDEISSVAEDIGIKLSVLKEKIRSLSEFNPMLGHRGCRLGITYPEITEMQTRAILEAALDLKKRGVTVLPEIMIPLIGTPQEFRSQKLVIDQTAEKVFEEQEMQVSYKIGTMIEIPRAALVAGEIARDAEFFSFGTNDLTQMTFGYSRDDAGKFLGEYLKLGILAEDPFQVLDIEGVGQLVAMAAENGRKERPGIKIGICGEHGGEPKSVTFFYSQNLDYVSCSPYRVPVARLSAAQAHLKDYQDKKIAAASR